MSKLIPVVAVCVIGVVTTAYFFVPRVSDQTLPCQTTIADNDVAGASLVKTGLPMLPPDAKNVEDRGNGWLTFELNVGGRNRKFLCVRHRTYAGYSQMSITELHE